MKHFTISVSIIALGASMAFVAPGELPSAENGYSFWAEAEASNIRKTRIKQRNNGLYKSVVTTDETDGEGTDSVEVVVSTLVGQPLVETTVKKADWTRVSFKGVDGLSAEVEPIEYQDGFDNFNMPTQPGDTNTAEIGKTKTFLSVTNNGDGSFDVTLEGEPKNMNDFCAVKVVDSGLCGNYDPDNLRLGGHPLIQDTIEADWDANLSGKFKEADIEGTKIVVSATAYGENGEVLDSSATTASVGDAGGEELDYAEFRIEGDDDDYFLVISESEDTNTETILDVRISSDNTGVELVNDTSISARPFNVYSVETVTFTEASNVTDQEYEVQVTFLDALGNQIAFGRVPVIGAEAGENFKCCEFEEPFEGPPPLDIGISLDMNADGETFELSLGAFGELANIATSANFTLIPIDGGSETEEFSYNASGSGSVNVWSTPTLTGAETFEIALASETLSYRIELNNVGLTADLFEGISSVTELNADTPFLSMEDLEDRFASYQQTDKRRRRVRYAGEIIRRKAGKAAGSD